MEHWEAKLKPCHLNHHPTGFSRSLEQREDDQSQLPRARAPNQIVGHRPGAFPSTEAVPYKRPKCKRPFQQDSCRPATHACLYATPHENGRPRGHKELSPAWFIQKHFVVPHPPTTSHYKMASSHKKHLNSFEMFWNNRGCFQHRTPRNFLVLTRGLSSLKTTSDTQTVFLSHSLAHGAHGTERAQQGSLKNLQSTFCFLPHQTNYISARNSKLKLLPQICLEMWTLNQIVLIVSHPHAYNAPWDPRCRRCPRNRFHQIIKDMHEYLGQKKIKCHET